MNILSINYKHACEEWDKQNGLDYNCSYEVSSSRRTNKPCSAVYSQTQGHYYIDSSTSDDNYKEITVNVST